MLAKENRLQKDKDFQKVFKGSRPVHTKNLVLRVAKQSQTSNLKPQSYGGRSVDGFPIKSGMTEKDYQDKANSYKLSPRFGFVISNKISKLATKRNALKRQLRAIIESELPNIKPSYDAVIMVKLDFKYPYKQEEIREQVDKGLTKAGLL